MRTKHRKAAHAKREYRDMLPKHWRPKLSAEAVVTVKIVHWDLIDTFTAGRANEEDMWDFMETGYTYAKLLQLLKADGLEVTPEAESAITDQLATYTSITARYRKTGRVGFNSEELMTARAAANVMNLLIDADRHGIALQAAKWSSEQTQGMRNNVWNP